MHRTFSPIVKAARWIAKRKPTRHEPGDTWEAIPISHTAARSELFPLQTSRVTGAHRWLFTDRTWWSPVLRTVRFADVRIPVKLATPDTPQVPGHAEIGVEVGVPAGLKDPAVTLSVLLPWETEQSGGRTVRHVFEDELTDPSGEVDGTQYEELLAYAREYLPDEPQGWDFRVEPDTLEVEPGSGESASLRIDAGAPIGIAFAVQAINVENAEEFAVSDVLVVACDEDGTMSVLYADD